MTTPAAHYKRADLFLKTADLIAQDRRGTVRDQGFHRGMRRLYEDGMKALVEALKSINRTLSAFYD